MEIERPPAARDDRARDFERSCAGLAPVQRDALGAFGREARDVELGRDQLVFERAPGAFEEPAILLARRAARDTRDHSVLVEDDRVVRIRQRPG